MGELDGKVAVITGGSTGIGRATAQLFVEEGAAVVITARTQEKLDTAVAEIGHGVVGIRCDAARLSDLATLHDDVARRFGQVDVLFANAGSGGLGPLGHVSEEAFDAAINTNLKGTFFAIQTLLPLLADGAAIILTTSIAGHKGFGGFGVYAATKAALRSFARSWTTDLKDRRIRVNALAPGQIRTDYLVKAGLDQPTLDAIYSQTEATTPLGRIGDAQDVARAALFLASDDSGYVSGVELAVDGGFAQV